jgi:PRC-barrel domain
MRAPYRAVTVMAIIALTGVMFWLAEEHSSAQTPTEPPAEGSAKPPAGPPRGPTMTVLDNRDVRGVLGKDVRSAADEDMGRIVDVIVDRDGQVKGAVIDFGGFLGVGSRKVAVAWNALRFPANAKKPEHIALELTRDQVRAAPEFKEDRPVVVLGASGNLETLPFP